MPDVNPGILVWARESAGLSPEKAVSKIAISDTKGATALDRLAQLESGAMAPTRPMLEKMAHHYHQPLLTFYLAFPPRKGNRGEDFRKLPKKPSRSNEALVDIVLRDLCSRQMMVRGILEEEQEARILDCIGSARDEADPVALAARIAKTITFDLTRYRKTPDLERARSYLRSRAEDVGIFVIFVDNLGSHHTKISVENFRGFALADHVAPFIAVNANDSIGAQIFTIVHELAHLWIGSTGVSGKESARQVEKFCNDVASAFLLPEGTEEMFRLADMPAREVVDMIQTFAHTRKVSNTMVAYTLHRDEVITFETYQRIAQLFSSSYQTQRKTKEFRKKGSGPAYSKLRRHRAGPALVNFVDRMLKSGAITTIKAGKILGVRGHSVGSILNVQQ